MVRGVTMKNLKAATIVLTTVLVLGFNTKTTASEIYVGDYCWDVNAVYGPTYLLKMEAYIKNGGQYALYGILTRESSVVAFHANAEIVGNEVMMSGLEPAVTSPVDASRTGLLDHTFFALLDKYTMNGSYYVKTGVRAPMNFTACP
jgi:hypothetical protein